MFYSLHLMYYIDRKHLDLENAICLFEKKLRLNEVNVFFPLAETRILIGFSIDN